MTYDLRRLRAHGLITRISGSHRYRVTDTGLHHAMLLTHVHTQVLQPGLARLLDPAPPACAPPPAPTRRPSTTSPGRAKSPHDSRARLDQPDFVGPSLLTAAVAL
jgi:hypothetical protein